MAGQMILALSILVSLHELGHFLAARAFGIKVEKFYLFFDAFGIKLFKFKKGDTEYGIGWLPLGGYVKIAGMIDESLDKDQLAEEPKDWEFRSKPAWQRLIVMLGGVTVNFFLGLIIFGFLTYANGINYLPASEAKYGIVANELGEKIGLKTGDRLLKINGQTPQKFNDFKSPTYLMASNPEYLVERNSETLTIAVPPNIMDMMSEKGKGSLFDERFPFSVAKIGPGSIAEKSEIQVGDKFLAIDSISTPYYDVFRATMANYKGKSFTLHIDRNGQKIEKTINLDTNGILGFNPKPELNYTTEKFGIVESFKVGSSEGLKSLGMNIMAFGKIFKGEMDPTKSLAGPIKMATFFGAVWDWTNFWLLTGLISLILAFMNLLPIPALDGGHVVFLLIEMIRRKPLPDKVMYVFQTIGMIILILLMVFIFGNDIFGVITNR